MIYFFASPAFLGVLLPVVVTFAVALCAPLCTEYYLYVPVIQWFFYPIIGSKLLKKSGFAFSTRYWLWGVPICALVWAIVYWPQVAHRLGYNLKVSESWIGYFKYGAWKHYRSMIYFVLLSFPSGLIGSFVSWLIMRKAQPVHPGDGADARGGSRLDSAAPDA
jgi:hypothetical protein